MISKNQLGIIFMILSVISFSVMDIVVKLMSSHYPIGQLIFFRGFFGLIPILFIIPKENLVGIKSIIPLGEHSLGWALPALLCFLIVNVYNIKKV